MGSKTSFTVNTVRFPGRGSDYFGDCEVCQKSMSETAVFEQSSLYKHADGFLYLGAPTPGVYAHMGCKVREGLYITDKATLPRRGKLIEYPRSSLLRDLLGAGFSEQSASEVIP